MRKRKSRTRRRLATNKNRIYTAKYKKWVKSVFQRDCFKCILCCSSNKIQSHHIVRHADSIRGRLLVSNGCTLCKKCHDKVTGKEIYYAPMLRRILRDNAK